MLFLLLQLPPLCRTSGAHFDISREFFAPPRPEHNTAGVLGNEAVVAIGLCFIAPKVALRQLVYREAKNEASQTVTGSTVCLCSYRLLPGLESDSGENKTAYY